jgi:proline racemase
VREVAELLFRGLPRERKIEWIQIREMPAHRVEASLVVEVEEVEEVVEDLTYELELVVLFRVAGLSPGLSGFPR